MAPSRPLNQFDKDTSNGDAAWPAYRPGVSSPSNEGTFASTSGHHESRGLLTDHVYGSSTHAALPASAAAGFEILPGPAPQSTGSSYQPPAPREVALSGALTLPPSIGAVEPSQRQRSGSASGAGIVPALFGQPSTGVNRQGSTGTHAATHN